MIRKLERQKLKKIQNEYKPIQDKSRKDRYHNNPQNKKVRSKRETKGVR